MRVYLPYLVFFTGLSAIFWIWMQFRLYRNKRSAPWLTHLVDEEMSYLQDQAVADSDKIKFLEQLPTETLLPIVEQVLVSQGFGKSRIIEKTSQDSSLNVTKLPVSYESTIGHSKAPVEIFDRLLMSDTGEVISVAIQRGYGSRTLSLVSSYSRTGLGHFKQYCKEKGTKGIYIFLGANSESLRITDRVLLISAGDMLDMLTVPQLA